MKTFTRFGFAAVLILTLLLTGGGIAVAAGNAKHASLTGAIDAYEAGKSITIKSEKGASTTLVVNGDTKINLGKQKEVAVGLRAIVSADLDASTNEWTAKTISLLPGTAPTVPGKVAVKSIQANGIVDAYEAGKSITIKNAKGAKTVVTVTADTKIFLKAAKSLSVGDRVLVLAKKDGSKTMAVSIMLLASGNAKK